MIASRTKAKQFISDGQRTDAVICIAVGVVNFYDFAWVFCTTMICAQPNNDASPVDVTFDYDTERGRIKQVAQANGQTTTTYYAGNAYEKIIHPDQGSRVAPAQLTGAQKP